MSTATGTTNPKSVAAQLRENLMGYFEVGDLESLCFDLHVDYNGLPGDGQAARVVSLIEYFGRTGRLAELVNRCAQLRPNVSWTELQAAAVSNPALFQPAVPVFPEENRGGGQALNLPPDRALQIGIALGVVVVVLVLCGFSAGLVMSKFVSVTVNPVVSSPGAASAAMNELDDLQALAPGHEARLVYDNVKATSLANAVLVGPQSPVSEFHVQFLSGGDVALNTRVRALGNRRVILGFGLSTVSGHVVIQPKAVAIDLLGLPNTTFGWIAIPPVLVNSVFDWLQQQLDLATHTYFVRGISVGPDHLAVDMIRR